MNDEIKEIIEYFKDDIDYLEEELKYPNFKGRYITIRDKECEYLRKLLDYITNLQEENERLCNILDNVGYQMEGIIRTTEEFGISKNTGEVLSKHNIELLKNILKMINTKDVSILGSDKSE
jgi:hypothetical protein